MIGAIEAAAAVPRELGLRVDEARELGSWSNRVVHLAPSPVVARIGTLTSRIRPGGAWLDDELAVCAWLGDRVDPVDAEPAAAGAELRELHDA